MFANAYRITTFHKQCAQLTLPLKLKEPKGNNTTVNLFRYTEADQPTAMFDRHRDTKTENEKKQS
jgi:hypothetical protein